MVYIFTYFLPNFNQSVIFYKKKEVERLLKEGKSIIRLGDGEMYILISTAMEFHASNQILRKKLHNIVKRYSKNDPFVLALPSQITESNLELKKRGIKDVWHASKVVYFISFPKRQKYADALMFYPRYDKKTFSEVVLPFLEDRVLIFVTKGVTIEKIKESDVFHKRSAYVVTPEKQAFDSYDYIKGNIDLACSKFSDKKEIVLLFALGPVGKVMAAEYSEQGYQCIDIGKGLDFIFS